MGGSAVVIVIILYNGSSPREHQQIQTSKMEKAEEGRELEGDWAFRIEEKGFQEELKTGRRRRLLLKSRRFKFEWSSCVWLEQTSNTKRLSAILVTSNRTRRPYVIFGYSWKLVAGFYFMFFYRWALLCSSVSLSADFWHTTKPRASRAPPSETRVILTQNKTLSLFHCVGSRSCFHSCVLTPPASQALLSYYTYFKQFVINSVGCQRRWALPDPGEHDGKTK